jgi:hypothetical protein
MSVDSEPVDGKRPARPLGRGLEEISYLFLSQQVSPAAGQQGSSEARRPAAQPIITVMRTRPSLTRTQVIGALEACRAALGDDVLAIGPGIACSPYAAIDLLAVDRAHHVMVVEVSTALDDGIVVRGLSHVDWVVRNLDTVQRLYPGWPVDPSRPPRLSVVAPRFSLTARTAIRQLTGLSISCFRYCEVDLSGETGIFIERV